MADIEPYGPPLEKQLNDHWSEVSALRHERNRLKLHADELQQKLSTAEVLIERLQQRLRHHGLDPTGL